MIYMVHIFLEVHIGIFTNWGKVARILKVMT